MVYFIPRKYVLYIIYLFIKVTYNFLKLTWAFIQFVCLSDITFTQFQSLSDVDVRAGFYFWFYGVGGRPPGEGVPGVVHD